MGTEAGRQALGATSVVEALVVCAVLAVVMVGAAATMSWLCRKVAADALPPQDRAGIRTRWAIASDEAWYAAQRAGLPAFRAMAWISAVVALVCAGAGGAVVLGRVSPDAGLAWSVAGSGAGCLLMLALVPVCLRRARRAVDRLPQRPVAQDPVCG
nr:SdpI family protein [Actinomyces sp.]